MPHRRPVLRRLPRTPLLALVLALVPPVPARGEVPLPTFPGCGADGTQTGCPDDLGGNWHLYSYVPEAARASVREVELEIGSGCHADRAWQYTTGRWDVSLAFLDSGFEWSEADMANKVRLNDGELPFPQDARGTSAVFYDLNGDSVVNVQDWASDPRVDVTAGRDEADGFLDASDLLQTAWGPAWDGVDNDGNGYVDDIAGWDFFGGDNDAWPDYDEGYGTHGTGVAEDAAAEGGNGMGGIGVCPSCSILPVRVSDTFVVDGGRLGEAVAFAVDAGASVLNLSVGALTHPEIAAAALEYAHDQDVVVVAAAGDENAYHHNLPAVEPHALYVHSIRADNAEERGDDVYSYLNFFNCNNFGPRLDLVATNAACATGAVSVTTGVAGLVVAAGLDAGLRLSADEVRHLLLSSADDVWLTEEERERAGTYPSHEGWDPFFGHGKVNAEHAVQLVVRGYVPPEARLDAPGWFEVVDPGTTPRVDVVGHVSADRAASYDWTLEVGTGWDSETWEKVASGRDLEEGQNGVLATLDLADLPPEVLAPIPEPDEDETVVERAIRAHTPAVNLRLRVTDDDGDVSEERRTFFVRRDPDLLPGFPVQVGTSGESSPVLADLDGDAILEIVIGTSDGQVLALRGDGSLVDGYPVRTDPMEGPSERAAAEAYASGAVPVDARDGLLGTVAVGDLEGDGVPDVVAATTGGAVYAWEDATLRDGFPVWMIGREPEEIDRTHRWDRGFLAAPTLSDLDGDGAEEIVIPGLDGRLYVFTAEGADWGPYPVDLCAVDCALQGNRVVTSATIGDADGDGDLDIALGSNEALENPAAVGAFLLDAATAESLPGWPFVDYAVVPYTSLIPMIGEGHPASIAMADVDGDGDDELASSVVFGQNDLLHGDGTVATELAWYLADYGDDTNMTDPSLLGFGAQPAFGDLDGDAVPDLAMGAVGSYYVISLPLTAWWDYQVGMGAWSGATGAFLPGFPRQMEGVQLMTGSAIADVTGDGRPEVIAGSSGFLLHAWDAEGNPAAGWPHFAGSWLLATPAVGDVDGDGWLDVVVSTRAGALFAWTTRGRADQAVQWASIHHDARNSGNASTPLPAQAGPPDPVVDEGGCGCGKGNGADTAFLLLPGLWLGRRRRSRPTRLPARGGRGVVAEGERSAKPA